jgi:adenylate cyclase
MPAHRQKRITNMPEPGIALDPRQAKDLHELLDHAETLAQWLLHAADDILDDLAQTAYPAHFQPRSAVFDLATGLFTDVQNFTGITEAADPDNLMRQTSRYFTVLTDAFLAEGGTVDKYIGDAVMVFWNAPHPQPDHVERACRAALAAKAASEILNQQFESEGLPRFVTRFGIHVGDAVVGNVGSAERMDYTVLGSSVNLAARLEGLNKEYGTTILVSDAVRERAEHDFRFRPVASVTAKGMTNETRVYELLAPIVG